MHQIQAFCKARRVIIEVRAALGVEPKRFETGLHVIEKMERETGLEPATSSLGI